MKQYQYNIELHLPERTPDEIEEIYQDLIESLFHQTDENANLIKQAFRNKYPFIEYTKIENW